jgi:DNA-binding transcriptional LysR family regulator
MSQIPQQFYYKKNRLQQLRGFYYTIQTGSLSKAAKKMGLTQSTITLQIQSLERDLNTKLLNRNSKTLEVTKDGKLFHSMASYHLSGIDSLYDEFLQKKNKKERKINIAVHHVAISYLIPPYIKKFQEKHSEITIGIQNIGATEAIKRLQDNEIDCILYPNIEISDEFLSKTCFSFDPMLIMSKDHPLASKKEIQLQDIAQYNTVRIDKKLISLPLFEQSFKEFGFKTNIEFENGNW